MEFKVPKQYEIDFKKVQKLDDVVQILIGLNITVPESYEGFSQLKPFLKEINK